MLSRYELKGAVAFACSASFSVRKRAPTVKGKQESHQHLGDTEETERADDADEEKKECSEAE